MNSRSVGRESPVLGIRGFTNERLAHGAAVRSENSSRPHIHWRLSLIALLAIWQFPGGLKGQVAATGSVRGKVVAQDGSPVNGALLELIGRSDSVRTSASGQFLVESVSVGFHVLRIRALGYVQKSQEVRVAGDSGWAGSIVLDRVPQSLPEVHVKALGKPAEFANTTKYDDYFRRRRLGFGTFRTYEDIKKMGAGDLVSVLQGMAGVSVTSTSNPYGETEIHFRMARCPGQPPNLGVYINGTKVALFGKTSNRGSELSSLFRARGDSSSCSDCARMAEVLSSVALYDILFVEFYRGPGQIPNDLDRGDSCAALVIWTR